MHPSSKKTPQSPEAIQARIDRIKAQLLALGPMRPGSLSIQYRNPQSKTKPFLQISYTHQGRGRSEYVRPENLDQTRIELANFKRFRQLVEEWTDLSLELSRLRVGLKKASRSADQPAAPKKPRRQK